MKLTLGDLTLLGSWTAPAANEVDTDVDATTYLSVLPISPVASSEIEELRWIHPTDAGEHALRLAPLLRDSVFPAMHPDR